MKVRTKIILVTGSLALIILGMFLVTWWVTNNQKNDGALINMAGRQRMLSQKMTRELLEGVSTEDRGLREKAFNASANSMRIFNTTLNSLMQGGEIPLSLAVDSKKSFSCPPVEGEALQLLQNVQPLWKEYRGKMERVIAGAPSAKEDLRWIKEHSNNLLAAMNKAVVQMQKDAESSVFLLLALQLAGLGTGIFFSIIGIIVIQKVIGRLNQINEFAQVIGSGDLSRKSGIRGEDEIGQIGHYLDDMSGNLNNMFGEVSENSQKLSDLSTSLGNIAVEMQERAKATSSISVDVAQAAEQMSANMNTVAAATEEASTNIALVSTATEEMTSTITEIVNNTEQAQTISGEAVAEANSASEKVDELGLAATEIGKVTETITEISEQTNLLALNATIEAARAGEAGKGFAVVANEIKDLAKQTADATHEIKSRIEGIQNSTAGTVTQIQQITKIINEVNSIVSTITTSVEEQSATTMEIADNISQASLGIQEVTENVAQLSTVSSEVASDMSEVSEHSQATSNSADKVKDNGEDIQNLAQNLEQMVSKITL
ncbi:methyl-accepting chemotaxis protein [Desulfomarina sp.]